MKLHKLDCKSPSFDFAGNEVFLNNYYLCLLPTLQECPKEALYRLNRML